MSADNWTTCPACSTKHANALEAEQQRVAALYGKVSVEEFDCARAALSVLEAAEPEQTLREDYEIGIHNGAFDVSYRGGCEKCGFEHTFKHNTPLYPDAESVMSDPTDAPTPAKRIQRKRTKGWKMPKGAIYVGRPTVFGNPFILQAWFAEAPDAGISDTGRRRMAVEDYRRWLLGEGDCGSGEPIDRNPPRLCEVRSLRGKDLACWCPLDQPCHADVLLELANAE